MIKILRCTLWSHTVSVLYISILYWIVVSLYHWAKLLYTRFLYNSNMSAYSVKLNSYVEVQRVHPIEMFSYNLRWCQYLITLNHILISKRVIFFFCYKVSNKWKILKRVTNLRNTNMAEKAASFSAQFLRQYTIRIAYPIKCFQSDRVNREATWPVSS